MHRHFRRRSGAAGTLTATFVMTALIACSPSGEGASEPTDPPSSGPMPAGQLDPTKLPTTFPDRSLQDLQWAPKFEPDYNNLEAQPWVEPTTKHEADVVVVRDGELEFPANEAPEVLGWEPGRVVASAPGEGPGSNPLGFARRVLSVREEAGKIIVTTEPVELEDLVAGDFQSTFDPSQDKPLDLSKLDLEWAAKNLYYHAEDSFMPGESLVDDYPLVDVESPENAFLGKVGRAIGGAAKAVGSAAQGVYSAITPASFEKSVNLSHEVVGGVDMPLFKDLNYKKTINGSGRFPMELYIKGNAKFKALAYVNPGFQVGVRVPNILHKNPNSLAAWLSIDSKIGAKVGIDLALEAGISSVSNQTGNALSDKLQADGDFAAEVWGKAREGIMGDPDMKPVGGWRKPIFLSKPSTKVVMAGPVPVVIVSTFQVDFECGFEAKASITAKVDVEQGALFKFGVFLEKGKDPKMIGPLFERVAKRDIQVLGGGSVTLACGLIPRVNTFLYDAVGINAGIRGTLVARGAYESKCTSPTSTRPTGNLALGLYGNFGVQVGGRLQVPGSSHLGAKGQKAGIEIGPWEPWNTEFPIIERSWTVGGLGYCTPRCKNGSLDEGEVDVDCGGACGACGVDKKCRVNSDCARPATCNGGVCKVDQCKDGVVSGTESDVDCGGKTCAARCAVGKTCQTGSDCASGFCAKKGLLGVCVADHCKDGVKDADESGIDCGGSRCGKCQTGTMSAVAQDCASGVSDGTFCVANVCLDRKQSAGESDVECGGTSSCGRCGVGMACTAHTDCSVGPIHTTICVSGKCVRPGAPSCDDGARNGKEADVDCGAVCSKKCGDAQTCGAASDCASGVCTGGRCAASACTDGVQNGDETDLDCGGSCNQKCAPATRCEIAGDCTSGVCGSDGLCAAPTCEDGVRNGKEGDVDCGGGCGARCTDGQRCSAHGDCTSDVCGDDGHCAAPSCTDGVKNGTEKATDCGGSCGPCADGLACDLASGCQSGVCTSGTCAGATCVDGVKNGGESDVDCGGSCTTKCADGKICKSGDDCTSGNCDAGTCKPAVSTGAIVFLSSEMYTGNLGGLAGADAKCQALASAASLPGTYKAFLSDSITMASARLTRREGPYHLVDGTVVAQTAAAFFSASHLAGIGRDENGNEIGGEVWTGSSASGTGFGGCSNWTSTSGTATIGLSWETNGYWANRYAQFCDRNNVRLYCIQQ
jgi:hypothetical protein